jgi:hypothetical protein
MYLPVMNHAGIEGEEVGGAEQREIRRGSRGRGQKENTIETGAHERLHG